MSCSGVEKHLDAAATLSLEDLTDLMRHRGDEAREYLAQNFGSAAELCRQLGSDPVRGKSQADANERGK